MLFTAWKRTEKKWIDIIKYLLCILWFHQGSWQLIYVTPYSLLNNYFRGPNTKESGRMQERIAVNDRCILLLICESRGFWTHFITHILLHSFKFRYWYSFRCPFGNCITCIHRFRYLHCLHLHELPEIEGF